jgi:hypothetical protein
MVRLTSQEILPMKCDFRMSRASSQLGRLAILLVGVCAGCAPAARDALDTSAGSPSSGALERRDLWESLFLEKSKIGHSRTLIRPIRRGDQSLLRIDSFNHLKLMRFGQPVEQDLTLSTLETPDGRVLEFATETALGAATVKTFGRVDGEHLVIEGGGGGTTRIAWSDDVRGFRGLEQSLEANPLKPGEHRTLKVLAPLINQVAVVEMVAGEVEPTDVLGKPRQLLRIETTSRLPDGNVLQETLWSDAAGETIKRRVAALGQESHRATADEAKAEGSAVGAFDLGTDTTVKLDAPLADAHHLQRVRYLVELADGDPARVFPVGPTQTVRSLGPHEAELIVTAIPSPSAGSEPTTVGTEYSTANSMLEIDDPRVRAMAVEARGNLTEPRQIAKALERYVREVVVTKDFSQTFASAAEVAASRQGDCTEHAVLLAALARACDIPSRVAIGLVYVPALQGFGYHMWTEVYVDGGWLPLDATLGQGGIGAAHLKLSDSSLEGAGAFSTFLPVAQVVGQLKIKVLEAP